MRNVHTENLPVARSAISARRKLTRYLVAVTITLGQFTMPALAAERGSIKGANKAAPATARPAPAQPRAGAGGAKTAGANANQGAAANKNGTANQAGNANANKNANVNANQNANVNKNSNVNVNNNTNVNVDRDVHGTITVEDDNDDHFWGGVAVGVMTTLAIGAIVKEPPPNPQVVVVNGQNLTYSDGVYYQQGPSGYTVVPAPQGATIKDLPPGSETVAFNSVTYFYSGGVFYAKQGAGYTVVNTPIGITVAALPPGATQTVVGGDAYFLYNGIHYKPVLQNGVTVYTTVKM